MIQSNVKTYFFIIIVGAIFGYLLSQIFNSFVGQQPIVHGDYQRFVPKDETIVIYTAPWCKGCRFAKDFLASNGIEYSEKDIDNNALFAQELSALGHNELPLIVSKNKKLVGFNENAYQQFLNGWL